MAKKETPPVVAKKEDPKTGGFPGDNGYVGISKVPVVVEEVETSASLELCNLVAQGMSVSEAKAVLGK